MATHKQIVQYLLARICSSIESDIATKTYGTEFIVNTEQILKDAEEYYGSATHTTMTKEERDSKTILESQVKELYKLYPSKCPIQNRSLGKSSKDKECLSFRIKVLGYETIKKAIEKYKQDCIENNVYMKNFSTFLNNIPLEEEQTKEVKQESQWQ